LSNGNISGQVNLKVAFDSDGTIGMYFRDMECVDCGTLATAPIEE
jgi:hypothetical protein